MFSERSSRTISLFSNQRRKPVFKQPLAHGLFQTLSETEGIVESPRWITSLTTLRYSDLFVSGELDIFAAGLLLTKPLGSWDGHIRIWQLDAKLKSFSLVGTVPIPGFISSLQLSNIPKTFIDEASWLQASNVDSPRGKSASPFMLVAAVGQEPRLGRWITMKDNGARNAAFAWVFQPRTSAS